MKSNTEQSRRIYDDSERIVRSLEGAAERGSEKNFRSAWKLIVRRPESCD